MTEKEMELRLEVAALLGLMGGIRAARPQWSDRRQGDLLHRVLLSQALTMAEAVEESFQEPGLIQLAEDVIKDIRDRNAEVATLERMLEPTDEK